MLNLHKSPPHMTAKFIRTSLMVGLIIVFAITVSSCGRKNAPVPPEGSSYPQSYPTE